MIIYYEIFKMKEFKINKNDIINRQLKTLSKVTNLSVDELEQNIKTSLVKVLLWSKLNINRGLNFEGVRIVKISSDNNKVIFKLRFPCWKWKDMKWSKKKM